MSFFSCAMSQCTSPGSTQPVVHMIHIWLVGYYVWLCYLRLWCDLGTNLPGDQKKGYNFLGFQAEHRCLQNSYGHIFGFPTKNMTISNQYSLTKKHICNSVVGSPTALLQISFVEIILRHYLVLDISLIENRISCHVWRFSQYLIFCRNCAITAGFLSWQVFIKIFYFSCRHL